MAAFETLRRRIAERPWRAGLYAFGVLALAALVLSGIDYLLRPENFPVRRVSFEGEFKHVDQQELASTVMDTVRGNFFLLDLDAVRERTQTVPWVYQASVQRRWPDEVHIRFTEQELVARWGDRGWVNAQGDYVDLKGHPGPDGLPRLEGPDGMQTRVLDHYRRLSALLAPDGLAIRVLTLTPRLSWNVALASGPVLTLGREEPEPKVARLARVWPQALAAQAASIRRVDLRYANGFAVEWAGRAGTPRAADVMPTGLNKG